MIVAVRLETSKQDRLNQMDFKNMSEFVGRLGNKEVRLWYKSHDERILDLIDKTVSLEIQARQAHDLRNEYRTHTRDLMQDQELRKQLDIKYPNKSFEYYYNKYKNGCVSDENVYRKIIEKSTTTNKDADEKAGVNR